MLYYKFEYYHKSLERVSIPRFRSVPHEESGEEARLRATRGGGRTEPRVFPTYRLGEDRESGGAATVQTENREYLYVRR